MGKIREIIDSDEYKKLEKDVEEFVKAKAKRQSMILFGGL